MTKNIFIHDNSFYYNLLKWRLKILLKLSKGIFPNYYFCKNSRQNILRYCYLLNILSKQGVKNIYEIGPGSISYLAISIKILQERRINYFAIEKDQDMAASLENSLNSLKISFKIYNCSFFDKSILLMLSNKKEKGIIFFEHSLDDLIIDKLCSNADIKANNWVGLLKKINQLPSSYFDNNIIRKYFDDILHKIFDFTNVIFIIHHYFSPYENYQFLQILNEKIVFWLNSKIEARIHYYNVNSNEIVWIGGFDVALKSCLFCDSTISDTTKECPKCGAWSPFDSEHKKRTDFWKKKIPCRECGKYISMSNALSNDACPHCGYTGYHIKCELCGSWAEVYNFNKSQFHCDLHKYEECIVCKAEISGSDKYIKRGMYSGACIGGQRYRYCYCKNCYEKEQRNEKGGCFIATAAYGDKYAHEIMILRYFRDNVLRNSISGNIFIKFYNFFSPPFATFIKNKWRVKRVIKIYCIEPWIKWIIKQHPEINK